MRVLLLMEGRVRELALLYEVIDSKVRGWDLVALKGRDVCHLDQVATCAIVMPHVPDATASQSPEAGPTAFWLSTALRTSAI